VADDKKNPSQKRNYGKNCTSKNGVSKKKGVYKTLKTKFRNVKKFHGRKPF